MGIFDESESGRTQVSRGRSRVGTARPSWPLSARFLVGALFVLNILLAAFLLRTETKRPGAPGISTPLPVDRPSAGSTPQLNAPPNQGSGLNQGSSRDLNAPRVEPKPAGLRSGRMAKQPVIKALPKALRASKPSRGVLSAPVPRAVIYPSDEPLARTPAPVRNPAAPSSASANAASSGRAPSFGIPAASVPSSPRPNAPASSALQLSAINHGLTSKGTRSGAAATVASVGLPAMEKGLVKPKMPVASVSSKFEIVPRPAVTKPENCGDEKVFIACPTLKIRYDTPYTSEAP